MFGHQGQLDKTLGRSLNNVHKRHVVDLLRKAFSSIQIGSIKLHIDVKWCPALSTPSYIFSLSDTSVKSLDERGKLFAENQFAHFRQQPCAEDAIYRQQ